jgi:hypothetical protein
MDLYLEAARSGLPARQKGGSTPELRKQLESGPVIVLFRYPALLGSGGHFIVVTGYSSLMDSQRVYQAGGAQDAHPGLGATPAAWDGFTPLPRQARDGELVEPLEGDHAFGVTASQDGSKRPVARLSSSRSGFFLLWGDGRLSWMDEKRFEDMWSGSEMWMLTIDRVAKSRGGTSRD